MTGRLTSCTSLVLLLAGSLLGCTTQENAMQRTTASSAAQEPSRQPTETHLVPIPPIPEALRGCWQLEDADYPGETARMTVTATQLTIDGRTARPEVIESVTPRAVYGRFSAEEGNGLVTVATSLRLDADWVEPGTLIRQEGDAGSYHYRRCDL